MLSGSSRLRAQAAAPTCTKHPNEEIDTFCVPCGERVCESCRGEHKDHEWLRMKRLVQLVRQNEKTRCQELTEMVKKIKNSKAVSSRKKEKEKIRRVQRDLKSMVDDIAEMMVSMVDGEDGDGQTDIPQETRKLELMLDFFQNHLREDGRKYSNKDAAQMWRGCDSTMKKESFINVSMKGNTFLSKYEPKVKYFVNDLKQVNALTLYARQTPCGKQLIVSNSILLPRVKKFLLESSNYLASVRRILKKMTEEDDEYISTVLTGHSKIRNIRKISRKELQKEEKQILQELLQADLFDKAAKPKICRLIK
ncbi:hypothetical protein FSP39_006253 [Pinctada imbricata]|uniref:B box-type domain-containing protein n=1 Tax=Pinctada imbricata TaxID=66713 RepID=A0AA88YQM1_PINIB|nr:hypothetical protein FSP39_006253 [Pinctada imbricata]